MRAPAVHRNIWGPLEGTPVLWGQLIINIIYMYIYIYIYIHMM